MKDEKIIYSELGDFLTHMIPVPWDIIFYYAEVGVGWKNAWFAYTEKETGKVITLDNFFRRYENYPFTKIQMLRNMMEPLRDLVENAKNREDKIWNSMTFVITEDGVFHVDFSYEESLESRDDVRAKLVKEILNADHAVQIKGKYPSLE